MKLCGIEFGPVLGASGVEGFFGEGYWFHVPLKRLGVLDFSGMTFTAKTATLLANEGHMPLTERYTPREWFPECVWMNPWTGDMLNAVGLSNPGLQALLDTGQWQERTEPFWISVMAIGKTLAERLDEVRRIVDILLEAKERFAAPFGVQKNLSCPNTGHALSGLVGESIQTLHILQALDVPVMPKYSVVSTPTEAMMELEQHPACHAICVSNTFRTGSASIPWHRVFGGFKSPLARFGGGGLSGPRLRPLVCDWIARLRDAGFTKPINGGGGIFHPRDVNQYHRAGASSIFVGSVASQRPWQVQRIIRRAYELDWRYQS
ncbi:hypothetical protein COU77_03200 [Candidatus Peregrinibacteria bacterium CG10_big_fil_rev_8_21_14_0_10_49_16]|nr:MAG: hypothetical protein COW95_01990 [Candidatus Peregrinibacteria bacterium CG22_combo_CG10-13_8_21_14_all_49_11]PIR51897.1 MAG: hypothetical protein COU77_03200 [Candidatus Peregrinibacteria bacterium CG10_big_fil_rev_8_21_14_0_10_49_16]